eukprot:5190924-Amphidinium_carterae.1
MSKTVHTNVLTGPLMGAAWVMEAILMELISSVCLIFLSKRRSVFSKCVFFGSLHTFQLRAAYGGGSQGGGGYGSYGSPYGSSVGGWHLGSHCVSQCFGWSLCKSGKPRPSCLNQKMHKLRLGSKPSFEQALEHPQHEPK